MSKPLYIYYIDRSDAAYPKIKRSKYREGLEGIGFKTLNAAKRELLSQFRFMKDHYRLMILETKSLTDTDFE